MPTSATSTKVTTLTGLNMAALRVAKTHGLDVELTKTTATFPGTPAEAIKYLDAARDILAREFGTRGHPVASIPAVRRKLQAKLPTS